MSMILKIILFNIILKNGFDTVNLKDNYHQIIILHRIFKKRKEHLNQLIFSKSKAETITLKFRKVAFQN